MNDKNFYKEDESVAPAHYYGDIIRVLFITAGTFMIISLPFFKDQIPVSPVVAIFSVVVLGVFAGFVSPKQTWVSVVDSIISLFAVLVFEYYAVISYKTLGQIFTDPFFLLNQVLACIFFVTLYLSVKTLRAAYFD